MSSRFWRYVFTTLTKKGAKNVSINWTPSVVASVASGFLLGYAFSQSMEQSTGNSRHMTSSPSHSLSTRNASLQDTVHHIVPHNNGVFEVIAPPSVDKNNVADVTKTFSEQCMEIARYGLPSTSEVRCYGGYLTSLNYERRIPNWVMEMIDYPCIQRNRTSRSPNESNRSARDRTGSGARVNGGSSGDESDTEMTVSRQSSMFYADNTVPKPFRARPQDYSVSGYSRGHLAAAQLHKRSQEEMDATFNINANIVPQDMTFNALDWQRLENLSRNVARDVCKDSSTGRVYVVSGPAFVPRWVRAFTHGGASTKQATEDASSRTLRGQLFDMEPHSQHARAVMQYDLIQRSNEDGTIAIPTHLYKVILAETETYRGPAYRIAAFLMPNAPSSDERPLTDYAVDLATLEKQTGLIFFPKLIKQGAYVQNLCASYKCDTPSKGIFRYYRDVAKLRLAQSIPELNNQLAQIQTRSPDRNSPPMDMEKNGNHVKVQDVINNEYQRRKNELLQQAIRSIDEM